MFSIGTYQDQPVCFLQIGSDRAAFAPQGGARLLFWEHDGHQVVTWPQQADWSKLPSVRGGNPILFPFIARHFVDGQIGKWRDELGVVRDMPMHGFARNSPFAVIPDPDPCTIRMRLEDTETSRAMYPFKFRFDVIYRLEPGRLTVTMETTNTGDRTLPYYPGHHFYLAVPHDQRGEWIAHLPSGPSARQNKDGSMTLDSPAAPTLLSDPALSDRMHRVGSPAPVGLECTSGDSPHVLFHLDMPGSIPWYAVTTWTQEAQSDFYCVEPWLAFPNAISHGLGLRHLDPGQSEKAICSLETLPAGDFTFA